MSAVKGVTHCGHFLDKRAEALQMRTSKVCVAKTRKLCVRMDKEEGVEAVRTFRGQGGVGNFCDFVRKSFMAPKPNIQSY